MGRYVLQRIISLVPILFGISVLVFLILHLVPGNPVLVILGTEATEESIKALTLQLGLDQPLIIQYLKWIGGVLHGDFGVSVRSGGDILPELLKRFNVTLQLTLLSILISWIIAIPVGMLSAVKANKPVDIIARSISMLGISVPSFAIGTLLMLVMSLGFNWFPPLGFVSLWDDPVAWFKKLILPSITVGVVLAGGLMRMTRSSFMETLDRDFIRTARAKGNTNRQVLIHHAFRNSSIPILTLAGMQFGYLLGGSVIIEQLFSIPGLGQYILDGIYHRDYPVVQGGVLFVSVIFVSVNLIVDIIYSKIDPRIKY
ncbi:peptide/nickel transport system permease protein [Paenibacillus sp. yr247]|uniref:ABC transporter permease n=1 Tax=Paenibacillus sp. yr247 TaxID=1761880 RepID=UPI000890B22E|nr:ABC transporter permease [Paenibacillus sp. yr247]SDN94532.1 peptide/nickel transport system permease protein [Paenibacillus sp. yr247]